MDPLIAQIIIGSTVVIIFGVVAGICYLTYDISVNK